MHVTTKSVLAAGALALAVGCAPSNPGLTAQGVIAADMTCIVTPTGNLRGEGALDLDHPELRPGGIEYSVWLRVGNSLINNGNRVYPLQADPNVINVDHVEVTLMDAGEATLSLPGAPNPYLVPATGTIDSTDGADATIGLAAATIIPSSYGTLLAGQFTGNGTVLTRLRVMGTTSGGSQLTSGPMFFPIQLCHGCLFQPTCDSMGLPVTALSCTPGQDGVSDVPPGSLGLSGCP